MSKWKALSAVGLIAIALHEGWSDKPYLDVAGIWTNGFGNTHNAQQKVTVPQGLDQLGRNVQAAETAINTCFKGEMSQQTFDALTSWAFNVGGGAACKSTAAKKWNAGDRAGSCRELLRWNRAGGVVHQGLVNRRQKESRACLEGLQ
jgi:lysozyme